MAACSAAVLIFYCLLPLKMPFSKKVINIPCFRFYPAVRFAFCCFFSLFPAPFHPLCTSAFQRFLAGEKQPEKASEKAKKRPKKRKRKTLKTKTKKTNENRQKPQKTPKRSKAKTAEKAARRNNRPKPKPKPQRTAKGTTRRPMTAQQCKTIQNPKSVNR